jgi:hypothetical protein
MANYNLTTQTISSSFEQLLQKNTDTGTLVNGVGSVIDELIVTASYALTASFAENVIDPTWDNITNKPTVVSGSSQISFNGITDKPTLISGSSQIDYPQISNIPSGIISSSQQLPAGLVSGSSQVSDITGSSLVTASFATQTLTFTKGDGTTFGVNIPDVSGSDLTSLNAFTQSQEVLNATFATTGSNTFVGNQIISGTLEMGPSFQFTTDLVEARNEMATPLFLVDSIEPNTGTDITLNATNFVVSSSIQMAPNTAVVGPLFEATSEVATPTLLVDTIEGNSDTEIDLLGRLKVSTAGDGDGRIEVNFDANNYSHLYGTTLEFFKNGAQGAKYTSSGPLSRITTAASLNPDGGMVLTGNSRAWSGLGIQPAVQSKAGAGIFYATGSTSETLPLASIKPSNLYDNKVYIGNDVDSLVLTGSLVEVSGTMVGPVFEATSEAATPLLLVDSLEPNTDTKISISSAINLAAQDPLPTGAVGDLAVSGSNLYFYNGAWTQVV